MCCTYTAESGLTTDDLTTFERSPQRLDGTTSRGSTSDAKVCITTAVTNTASALLPTGLVTVCFDHGPRVRQAVAAASDCESCKTGARTLVPTCTVDFALLQQCTCYAALGPPEFQQHPTETLGPVRLRNSNSRLAVRTLPYPPSHTRPTVTSATPDYHIYRPHHQHQHQQQPRTDRFCHCRVADTLAVNQHNRLQQLQLSHQQMLFVPLSMPANYSNHVSCPAQQSAAVTGGSAAAVAAAAAAAAAAVASLSNGGNPNAVSPLASIVHGHAASGLKVSASSNRFHNIIILLYS